MQFLIDLISNNKAAQGYNMRMRGAAWSHCPYGGSLSDVYRRVSWRAGWTRANAERMGR